MAPIVVEVEGDQERFQIKDENNDMDEAMVNTKIWKAYPLV